MAKFEILIPPTEAQGINIRLRVTADTWMAALKTGVEKLQLGTNVHDVIVEMNADDSISVQEPQSGRVFLICQLSAAQAVPTIPTAFPTLPQGGIPPPAPRPSFPPPPPPAELKQPSQAELVAKLVAAQAPLSQPKPPAAPPSFALPQAPSMPGFLTPSPTSRTVGGAGNVFPPSPEMPALAAPLAKPSVAVDPVLREPGRNTPQPPAPTSEVSAAERNKERRMAQAFFRSSELCAQAGSPADATRLFLDLSTELIPSDGAALFAAQIAEQDLVLVAVRGGRAELNTRVPMGEGIVGHSVLYNVPIHVPVLSADARFIPGSLDALGFMPRALLSAPIQKDGRVFGAFHLVRTTAAFADEDSELLAYLGARLGDFLERSYLAAA